MVLTKGYAESSIGPLNKINEVTPLVTTILGNKVQEVRISKNIDPNDLFYKIFFQATESDTVNGFEFTRKVIVNETLNEDDKRLDGISISLK